VKVYALRARSGNTRSSFRERVVAHATRSALRHSQLAS
jgi:hypothetical protein